MNKLLGIPYDAHSSFLRGPAKAPPIIRMMHSQGASNPSTERGQYLEIGHNLIDCGDLIFKTGDPGLVHAQIVREITSLIEDGSKLLVLGGDHYITYPVIEAFAKCYDSIHLLHFDAHSDLYENFENNYYSHASPFARIMEQGLVSSLQQIGLRTLCDHQRSQIDKYQVQVMEMKDFDPDRLDDLVGPLYISLDLDVLDPAYAPGISHYEPGGMSVRELINCLHRIKVPVIGADLVEYNPERDFNQMTGMVAYKLMKEIWSLF
ncbi:MAG: agmatinase [Saprospiraceae bacterium]|nr:agmatinase [Saprospiraceae bacterium]